MDLFNKKQFPFEVKIFVMKYFDINNAIFIAAEKQVHEDLCA